MAEQPILNVESRARLGSGSAHRLRAQGRVPGVIYGHGDPTPIAVDQAEFRSTVSPGHYGSLVVRLRLDGRDAGNALVKAVQVNPLGQRLLSVDLQRVSLQDRIQVNVPIVLEGEPAGARGGGVLEQLLHTVNLRSRAGNVPDTLTFDVSMLEIGDSIHTSQLALPGDSELLDKPDEVVAVLLAPTLPVDAETVEVEPGVSGPELTGEKQQDDFPPER